MDCPWEEFEQPTDGLRRFRCAKTGQVTPRLPLSVTAEFLRGTCGKCGRVLGVGDHLQILIQTLGGRPDKCDGECLAMIRKMNRWGADGCRDNRAEIVRHLKKAYRKLHWSDTAAFTARAVASGLAFKIGLGDAAIALVDLAIERAEKSS